MSRWSLGYQGRETELKYIITKDCLAFGDDVCAYIGADWDGPPVGRVVDYQVNDETGEMTAEIEFFVSSEYNPTPEYWHAHFYVNNVKWDAKAPDRQWPHIVIGGEIKAVFFVPIPGIPAALVQNIKKE
jgi:hypothetical protein